MRCGPRGRCAGRLNPRMVTREPRRASLPYSNLRGIMKVLHREQMDIIGSADRREQLRKDYPDCELHLTNVEKDRRGFTVLIVEVRSKEAI